MANAKKAMLNWFKQSYLLKKGSLKDNPCNSAFLLHYLPGDLFLEW